MLDGIPGKQIDYEALFVVLVVLFVVCASGILGRTLSPTVPEFFAAAAFIMMALLYLVIVSRWRLGIYALLGYLPVAGLPTILLYPAPPVVALLKDLLFVVPAYLGFIAWYIQRRCQARLAFAGAPIGCAVTLSALLLFHLFNPRLPNVLVGLIGLKIWLFYLPLLLLGYHFAESSARMFKLANVVLLTGMGPVLIGIAEAILIYSGHGEVVYDMYGPTASAVTQNFARFSAAGGGLGLVRIPSTFTFVLQYFGFLLCMLAISHAMWRRSELGGRARLRYLLTTALVVVAAFFSGARAAFVLIPGYFVLVALLDGKWRQVWRSVLVIMVLTLVGLAGLAAVMGSSTSKLTSFVGEVTTSYLSLGDSGLIQEFRNALNVTWIGVGTGMGSGASRFAFDASSLNAAGFSEETVRIESFYGKAIVELGIPGLIAVLALLGRMLSDGFAVTRQLRDPALRSFSVSLLSFLVLTAIYSTKASVLDYDPINVCFWLFAGMLVKLPALDVPRGGQVASEAGT